MNPEQLKQARHALGLSAAGLARALSDPDGDTPSVSDRTVRRWEAGERDIPGPVTVAIRYMLKHGLPA